MLDITESVWPFNPLQIGLESSNVKNLSGYPLKEKLIPLQEAKLNMLAMETFYLICL